MVVARATKPWRRSSRERPGLTNRSLDESEERSRCCPPPSLARPRGEPCRGLPRPWPFRPHGPPSRSTACGGRSPPRRGLGLARQRCPRRRTVPFVLERAQNRARSFRSGALVPSAGGTAGRRGALLRPRCGAGRGPWKLDARPSGLRQADSDRLLRGSRAVLALPYVMDFLTDEFAGLCAGRLSFSFIPSRPLQCGFLRHEGHLFCGSVAVCSDQTRRPRDSGSR